MIKAAVTGPSGSGKSTLCRLLAGMGVPVIDCDRIVREIEVPGEECFDMLVEAFGKGIVAPDGQLDRKKLARAAFSNEEGKARLNSITHRFVLERLDRETEELEKKGEKYCVIEAGALLESGLDKKVDLVILVTAPRQLLMERIKSRDGLNDEQAAMRLDAQTGVDRLREICAAELVNDGSREGIAELAARAAELLEKTCKGADRMEEKKESAGKQLLKQLGAKEQNVYKNGFAKSVKDEIGPYCRAYMDFMNRSKTEREFARNAASMLEEKGFSAFEAGKRYKAGDRIYWLNHKKSMIAAVIGSEPLDTGVLICAAHIDSPRLDLKPRPLYENNGLAYFKTHYYGGIKKYQWSAIPLSLHGTVVLKDGREVDLCIGEEEDDHVFYISDLLPHLARKAQGDRTMSEVLKGEELNILLGNEPFDDEEVKDPVKLNVLKYLNDRYGMVEDDFLSAEIEIVPAMKAKYVGFDDTLIAAYGHDDKVCAYTSLTALAELETPEHTCLAVLADKEEIGSVGNTGLNSDMLRNFLTLLALPEGIAVEKIFLASKCLSADVNAAFDPNFPQVCDPLNTAYLNAGSVVCKYTGSGGKSGSNDASAEYMGEVRKVLDDAGVPWQMAELGKVDEGGGGTVAMYVSHLGIDTVDIGVALLSMHSPYELAGAYDILAEHKAVNAFYRNM